MKVFIETSVFIRFLTRDDEKKHDECVNFFRLIQDGKLIPYTSNIAILEILFVLTRLYKFPKPEVIKVLRKILNLRNLTLIEKTNSQKALSIFEDFNIKYGDCLIASQISKGITLVTYDSDFDKLKFISSKTPEDVIKLLK